MLVVSGRFLCPLQRRNLYFRMMYELVYGSDRLIKSWGCWFEIFRRMHVLVAFQTLYRQCIAFLGSPILHLRSHHFLNFKFVTIQCNVRCWQAPLLYTRNDRGTDIHTRRSRNRGGWGHLSEFSLAFRQLLADKIIAGFTYILATTVWEHIRNAS